jgi:hypothetical protein
LDQLGLEVIAAFLNGRRKLVKRLGPRVAGHESAIPLYFFLPYLEVRLHFFF